MNVWMQLWVAPIVVLAEPLPPASDELVGVIVLVKQFVTNPFGIPHQHVVVNLHALGIQGDTGQPVGKPRTAEHLVIEPMFELWITLDVLQEHHLKEVGL